MPPGLQTRYAPDRAGWARPKGTAVIRFRECAAVTAHRREASANTNEASIEPGAACARLRLGCHPSVVAEARNAVGRIEPALPALVADSARLLVSELVTNSLLHGIAEGDGWIDVVIERRARCLRIEVADPASAGRRPVLRSVDPTSTSGWGLQLVDRLASDWGVETGSGTCVWCEIATG
jgi:anti-sigma regulatory factor (Ser/Thr protein kinase)